MKRREHPGVREDRELLFLTPGLGAFITGVILFEETLGQQSAAGPQLPQVLIAQGIVPGINRRTIRLSAGPHAAT